MEVILSLNELAMCLKPLNNAFISIFYEETLEIWNLICKAAFCIDRAYNRNTCSLEHIVVILTEARSGMNYTTAIFRSDIITADDDERTLLLQICKVWEEWLICPALEIGALHSCNNLIALSILVVLMEKLLSKVIIIAGIGILHLHVVDIRTDSKSEV